VCLSGLGRLSLYGLGEVPGQEFFDAADGMVSDLGQHGAEIVLRIEAVQLGRSDQAVHGGGTHSSAIGASEQIVLSIMAILA